MGTITLEEQIAVDAEHMQGIFEKARGVLRKERPARRHVEAPVQQDTDIGSNPFAGALLAPILKYAVIGCDDLQPVLVPSDDVQEAFRPYPCIGHDVEAAILRHPRHECG